MTGWMRQGAMLVVDKNVVKSPKSNGTIEVQFAISDGSKSDNL